MKVKVSCERCSGVCCINPPSLQSTDEIERALNLGAELVGIDIDYENDIYAVSVRKKEGVCPFLKDGNCSVYTDRFKACKAFECKGIYDEFDVSSFDEVQEAFITNINEKLLPIYFKKNTLDKYGIEIIGIDQAIAELTLTDSNLFMKLATEAIVLSAVRVGE